MADTGAHHNPGRRSSRSTSHWEEFDRELENINATLGELQAWVSERQRDLPPAPVPVAKSRARKPAAAKPSGHAEAAKQAAANARTATVSAAPEPALPTPPQPSIPEAPLEPPPAAAPAPPPLPTGTDLADPKNFGLMPPTADLEPGTASPEDYRKRLAQHLAFANKVLHTSRVPAPVWREWRAFEKAAHERFRADKAAAASE